MGTFKTLGTIFYMFGFLVMVIGLFFLIGGIVASVTSILGDVKAVSAEPSARLCASPPCMNETAAADDTPAVLAVAESALNGPIDSFMKSMGIGSMGDPKLDSLFYTKFRRFFVFMIVGLAIIVLGILLKLLDTIDRYASERGKKQPMEDKMKMKVTSAPEKNWVRYIDYSKKE